MRNLLIVLTIFLAELAFAGTSQIKLSCARRPANLALYRLALEQRVLNSIDRSKYERVQANVRFRLSSVSTENVVLSPDTITQGINVHPQNAPTGLSFSLSGEGNFVTNVNQCTYHYLVFVDTSARNKSSKRRELATTTSELTIHAPLEGRGANYINRTPTVN